MNRYEERDVAHFPEKTSSDQVRTPVRRALPIKAEIERLLSREGNSHGMHKETEVQDKTLQHLIRLRLDWE